MNYFVNIESLFSSRANRTLYAISAVYDNNSLLEEKIRTVIKNSLSNKNIQGKKVLLKPNWVKHSSVEIDELCMRTHDNFLLAALKVMLEFQPASVLIGDAPIQGCNWNKMISPAFTEKIKRLSDNFGIPVNIKDFRRVAYDPSKNKPHLERNPLSEYTTFDLGRKSFLEPITRQDKSLFRITNYNPDRLAVTHGPGVHKYCITNALFESDVVISLPKVKTHQKAGITAALKNIVGLNGDKDFLPHHRMGGSDSGGDCYPGNNILRYWSELMMDNANRRQGNWAFWSWQKLSILLWRISLPGNEHHLSAGWHGNDTTWRMVLDLNTIAIYGKKDGTLADIPQRELYSLCDGIIGGQGDGPLKPEPLPLGVISFTNHSGLNDIAMATLMGFDINRIPMLFKVKDMSANDKIQLYFNGSPIQLADLNRYVIKTIPPPGWEDFLNKA